MLHTSFHGTANTAAANHTYNRLSLQISRQLFKVRQKARKPVITFAASPNYSPNVSTPASGVDKEVIREQVNMAAATLDQLLSTIMREMFVDQATSYVTDEKPELEQQQVIQRVVAERLETLDANFLAALNVYIQVADKSNDALLCELLIAIRDEVLRQVAQRLPPAARVVDAALQHKDKDARVAVLRHALFNETSSGTDVGGSTAVVIDEKLPSGLSVDDIITTITQLIDDMEEQQVVADRRLLARMVLLREEVQWLVQERSFSEGTAGDMMSLTARFARRNVPQRCIAFLKELLLVNNPTQRIGLLTKALSEDWDGAAPLPTNTQQQTPASPPGQPTDYVRPGRFMATIQALEIELSAGLEGQGTSTSAVQDNEQGSKVLRRLGDVKMDTVQVLDSIQRGSR